MSNIPERTGIITSRGRPLSLLGPELKVGDTAPEFQAVDNAIAPVALSDFAGKVVLVGVTPSIDTSVCSIQAGKFNQMATELSGDVVILNISLDLPFALARWCQATGSDRIRTLSDYQEREFGLKYGVLIKELKLLTRSVWLIDRDGIIRYVEIVGDTTHEPDYEAALEALRQAVG